MITNFKIFESIDYDNITSMDVSIILEHKHIYVSVNEVFSSESDKPLERDVEKISEEMLQKTLNIDDLNNIESLKFYLICFIFDTNKNLNEYSDANIDNKKEILQFNFASITIDTFLDVLEYELKDIKEIQNDTKEIEDLLLFYCKDSNINETFYFKELWNLQSEKFKEENQYIFNAKNFDLI